MFCMYCGATIAQDSQFCEACGKRQNVAVTTPRSKASVPQPASTTSNKTVGWVILFVAALVFFIFHVVPAIIFLGVAFFWLFVLSHAGITRKNALIGTAVAIVTALGIQAYETSSESEHQGTPQQKQVTTQPQGDEFEQRVGELLNAGLSRADAEKSVRATMQNEAEARNAKEPAQIQPP